MKKRYFSLLVLALLFAFSACNRNPFRVDVSNIPQPQVHIHDYGRALFMLNPDSLAEQIGALQAEYAVFLGTEPLSSDQLTQLSQYVTDPFLKDMYQAYVVNYPTLSSLETAFSKAFQHVLYYYPNEKLPQVYAYISGVQDPILYQDNTLVIGMDNYLGADYEIYPRMGLPKYKIRVMTPDFVLRDALVAMSATHLAPPDADAPVLDQMLYEAKKLYFAKSMAPEMDEEIVLKYTPEQLEWFSKNESDLWKYYIENELLFKSDYESIRKLINDAPFTRDLGNDSPPRTGIWLGYQILKAYAKNTGKSLDEILANADASAILNQSKYKPGR